MKGLKNCIWKTTLFSKKEVFRIFQRIKYSQWLCPEEMCLFLYQTMYNRKREIAVNKTSLTVTFSNHCYLKC